MAHARGSAAAELLSTVRENPASLVLDPQPRNSAPSGSRPPATLGTKRGRGRGSFIDSVLGGVDTFYGEVLGSLRAWSAAPPKLRPAHADPPEVDETIAAALGLDRLLLPRRKQFGRGTCPLHRVFGVAETNSTHPLFARRVRRSWM